MAFGLDTGPFWLKEGLVEVGAWTNITSIGVAPSGDPVSVNWNGDELSYFRQGTTNVALTRSYAEARGFTPSVKLRKDLIQKDFAWNVEVFQYNADLMALARGLLTQAGYNSGVGFIADLSWVGSDEPVQPFYGYLITSELTDGTPVRIAMWYGKNTTEDIGLALSGTDYATTAFQAEAFIAPGFDATGVDAQKHYGMYWIDNSGV